MVQRVDTNNQTAEKQVRRGSQNAQKQEFSYLNDCFWAFCSKQSKKNFAKFFGHAVFRQSKPIV